MKAILPCSDDVRHCSTAAAGLHVDVIIFCFMTQRSTCRGSFEHNISWWVFLFIACTQELHKTYYLPGAARSSPYVESCQRKLAISQYSENTVYDGMLNGCLNTVSRYLKLEYLSSIKHQQAAGGWILNSTCQWLTLQTSVPISGKLTMLKHVSQ